MWWPQHCVSICMYYGAAKHDHFGPLTFTTKALIATLLRGNVSETFVVNTVQKKCSVDSPTQERAFAFASGGCLAAGRVMGLALIKPCRNTSCLENICLEGQLCISSLSYFSGKLVSSVADLLVQLLFSSSICCGDQRMQVAWWANPLFSPAFVTDLTCAVPAITCLTTPQQQQQPCCLPSTNNSPPAALPAALPRVSGAVAFGSRGHHLCQVSHGEDQRTHTRGISGESHLCESTERRDIG